MNRILILAFLFLGCLSTVAQKEVCESEEHQVNDFNSINKCVIVEKEEGEKSNHGSIKSIFIKKRFTDKKRITLRRNVVLSNEAKVSTDLIEKLLIKEEIDEGVLNNNK